LTESLELFAKTWNMLESRKSGSLVHTVVIWRSNQELIQRNNQSKVCLVFSSVRPSVITIHSKYLHLGILSKLEGKFRAKVLNLHPWWWWFTQMSCVLDIPSLFVQVKVRIMKPDFVQLWLNSCFKMISMAVAYEIIWNMLQLRILFYWWRHRVGALNSGSPKLFFCSRCNYVTNEYWMIMKKWPGSVAGSLFCNVHGFITTVIHLLLHQQLMRPLWRQTSRWIVL